MTKRIYIAIVLMCGAFSLFAQPRYGIIEMPVCHTDTSGLQQSLTRYVLVSSTGEFKTLLYTNSTGASVAEPTTGTWANGYCLCCQNVDTTAFLPEVWTVNSVAAIPAVPALQGDYIFTTGYASRGDGGGASYLVTTDSVSGYATDQIAVVEMDNGLYAVLQYEGEYKAKSFGVFASSDSITNRTGLQRAINFASNQNNTDITLGAGTYKFLISTPITMGQTKINITGTGSNKTYISLFPKIASTDAAWFDITNPDNLGVTELNITGMNVIGADTLNATILSWGMIRVTNGAYNVAIQDVNYSLGGNRIFYSTGSNDNGGQPDYRGRVLKIQDCTWSIKYSGATALVILHLAGGRRDNYLFVDNCNMIGGGGGTNTGHQFYVQPWLNFKVTATVFSGFTAGSAGAFQMNQTVIGSWPTFVNTKFQIIDGVNFEASVSDYDAINVDRGYFPGLAITNSLFRNGGGAMSGSGTGSMTIDNCTFFNSNVGLNPINAQESITISNCNFDSSRVFINSLGSAVKTISVTVTGCNFTKSSQAILIEETGSNNNADIRLTISNTYFKTTTAGYAVYVGGASNSSRFQMFLYNCTYEGARIFLQRSTEDADIRVDGGKWMGNNAAFATNLFSVNCTPINWTIRNLEVPVYANDFNVVENRLPFDTSATKFFKWYLPDFIFRSDVPIPSDNIPDSLKIGYGIYNITDPSNRDSITSIYLYDYAVASNIRNTTSDFYPGKYVAGELRLVAKNEFILGISGNINLTSPFVVRQNFMVRLTYNKATNEWDCINCSVQIPPGTTNNSTLAWNSTTKVWEEKTNLLNNGSVVGVGAPITSAVKLAVRADATATTPIQAQASAGTNSVALGNNGSITFGSNASQPQIYAVDMTSGGGTPTQSGASIEVRANSSSAVSVLNISGNNSSYSSGSTGVGLGVANGFTRTSGSNQFYQVNVAGSLNSSSSHTGLLVGINIAHLSLVSTNSAPYMGLRVGNTFAPASGAANYHNIYVTPTINQTGTASGEVTGITYAPTITSVLGPHYGFRSIPTTARNGFGVGGPTSLVHIGPGTITLAPLKIDEGSNLTTPQDGAIEHTTDNLNFTAGSTRYILAKTLTNTATLDFPSTAGGASSDLTVTVTGAAVGDCVTVGAPTAAVPTDGSFSAWVSAADTVTVRYANNSAIAVDPGSGTFRVSVIKY